jgi:putative transposase
MPHYRRVKLKGTTVFITMVTYKRLPILANPQSRQILRYAWHVTNQHFPFTTDAICLLPNHIHTLITLPEDEWDYAIRVREIKRLFTKGYLISNSEHENRNQSRLNKKEAAVWQRRYWDHIIRDEIDYQNHFDYIHFNPVHHCLVDNVASWQWSSFHHYVRLGVYDEDWGGNNSRNDSRSHFGE